MSDCLYSDYNPAILLHTSAVQDWWDPLFEFPSPAFAERHSCKFTTCSEPCFTFGNQIRHYASWLPSAFVEGDSAYDTQNRTGSQRTHWRVLCFPRTMTCAQEGYQSFQIK